MAEVEQPQQEVKLFNQWTFEDVKVHEWISPLLSLSDAASSEFDGELPVDLKLAVNLTANCGSREDATCIGSAGIVRRQAVDISPLRRVNQAIYLPTTGARKSTFRNIKTIAECLSELINVAKGSSNSYAIKEEDEIERVGKANR